MAEKTIKQQQTLNDLLQDSLGQREETVKTLRDQLSLEKELANLLRGSKDLSEKQLNVIGGVLDKSKDILDNQKEIAEETFNTVELEKLERKLINEGLGDRTQIIEKLKAQQRIQKQTNNLINAQAGVYEKIGGRIDGIVSSIPFFGEFLSTALGTEGLGKSLSEEFRTSAAGGGFLSGALQEFAGGAGVATFLKGDVSKIRSVIVAGITSGPLLAALGAGAVFAKTLESGIDTLTFRQRVTKLIGGATFDGLAEAFGNLDQANLRNIAKIRIQTLLFGTQAADLAKILQIQTEISGLTEEQAFNIQNQISQFASLRNVLPNDVIADIANNTELFAKFSKDGGINLGIAAVRARELGLNLSTVDSISSSLLDFQTSIESELKASLLIGRQLNLNRARELALAGDQAGLLEEIVKQVGTEAELNRMNVIERKALADALGISVTELSKLADGTLEFQSSDIEKNTQAIRGLTGVLLASAVGAGGVLASRLAPRIGDMISRGANRGFLMTEDAKEFRMLTREDQAFQLRQAGAPGTGAARAMRGGMRLAGGLLRVAGGIGLLVSVAGTIASLLRKNNDTQEKMAARSVAQTENFPIFSSEALGN
jgi:hypothetical protein